MLPLIEEKKHPDSPELDGLIEADQRRNAQQIEDHKCHKNTPNGGMLPPVF